MLCETSYQNATYYQPSGDPYEAFPTHVQHTFRLPEQAVVKGISLGVREKLLQIKPTLALGGNSCISPSEYIIHECDTEYANYVQNRAPQVETNQPNIYFCYTMQIIEGLKDPPFMVELVREYLERLIVQGRHDESNFRMKFQQLYYGLDDREVEEASMYRRMVDNIIGSTSVLTSQERDFFRKNTMVEWFGRRYKGNQQNINPNRLKDIPSWCTGPFLKNMAGFFSSKAFNRYLTSMHNYLLFLQIEFTKTWRRIGPLFYREWQSSQLGSLGRYGILIRALGSNGVDKEWEEFDYGYPKATGLGLQKRPPSERAEWVIELHPDLLAQDPSQLFRLIGQILHTEDWRSGSSKASNAASYTFNDVPIFPHPPAFLFPFLPLQVAENFLKREHANASSRKTSKVNEDAVRESKPRQTGT